MAPEFAEYFYSVVPRESMHIPMPSGWIAYIEDVQAWRAESGDLYESGVAPLSTNEADIIEDLTPMLGQLMCRDTK